MPKRNFIWLLAILLTALAAVWLTRAQQRLVIERPDGAEAVGAAFRQIQQNWYPGTDADAYRRQILERMVGMLDDPYSVYIPPQRGDLLSQRIQGKQRGVGLVLGPDAGGLAVLGSDPASPAYRAGILPGDRVLQIDQKPAANLNVAAADALLDGPVGTEHTLLLSRPTAQNPLEIVLRVEQYDVETVVGLGRDRDGKWIHRIGDQQQFVYVHVREFVDQTAGDFHQAVHLGGARGLILDLRGNPGGLLPAAIELTNMFLREGLIARVVSSRGDEIRHEAISNGTYPPVPVVVLIDGQSASGAELVAGALAHHRRGLVIGQASRGKGLIQSLIELPSQAGYLYLTTSEFLVAGESILPGPGRRGGIQPHQVVQIPPDKQGELARLRHIAGLLPGPVDDAQTDRQIRQERIRQILQLDSQLSAAIQWLSRPAEYRRRLEQDRTAAQPE